MILWAISSDPKTNSRMSFWIEAMASFCAGVKVVHTSFLVVQDGFEFFVYAKCHVLQDIEHG